MFKRLMSVCLCLALMVGLVPAISLMGEVEEVSAAVYKMPDTNGMTNNQTYILGEGTDVNVPVYTDWRSTSLAPTATMTPKYIAIHCTGAYPSTSTAKANHNYGKTAESACWHYTVGNTDIYQLLADNRQGWHVGKSYTGAPSNTNSIGLELAVNNFPATETFGGEQWDDGAAIMAWWDNQFHQTVKNAAYLTAVLCERWGLDWQTRVKMHWDSKSYDSGNAGKDCPMQMRATYDPSTNTFTRAGEYSDGRNGYFWQIFWQYLGEYANGAPSVNGTTATKIGTWQVTASDGLNVRAGTSTAYDIIGTLATGDIVKVTELSGNWGKVTLDDGTEGWCSIANYGNYIGIDALAYTNQAAWGESTTSIDSNGSMTIVNHSSTDTVGYDFMLPTKIGTNTTPYMSLQITPNSGNGYYFGIAQSGSGFFMMRDCQSSDQLVAADTAPYMTNQETLEINLKDWWKPTDSSYQVDMVRVYVAPSSSITINYFYFSDASGEVIDTRYNLLSADTNINLMLPDTLDITDRTKQGSYEYYNGMLTVVSDTADGFEVEFKVNMEVDPNVFHRFLISVNAGVRYDIELLCETSDGERIFSLRDDWYPGLCSAVDGDYIPAAEQSAGLDFLSCYTYNNVLPSDGLSTVKTVRVRVGGEGTVIVNSLQLAENDRLVVFPDGQSKSDSSSGVVDPTPSYDKGDVDLDGSLSTSDAREILLYTIGTVEFVEAQLLVADFNGDGSITTADARDMLLSVIA